MIRMIGRLGAVTVLVAALGALTARAALGQETSVVGDWEGVLSTGDQGVPVAFHIVSNADGALTATMDSPSQGALGIPLQGVTFVDRVLAFELVVAEVHFFEGTLSEDGSTLSGTWTQGERSVELTMTRIELGRVSLLPDAGRADHSAFRTSIGSTVVAFRAGTRAAAIVTRSRAPVTVA